MKRISYLFAGITLMAAACTTTPKAVTISDFTFSDTTRYVSFNMDIELPSDNNDVSAQMRQTIMDTVAQQLVNLQDREMALQAPSLHNEADMLALAKSVKSTLDSLSKADCNERNSYVISDTTLTDADKKMICESWPGWEYDITVKKVADTLSYVVFSSFNYVYMGGAHGGVSGAGYLTFDRKSGRLFTDFLKEECFAELKPLVRKGLCHYLAEGGEEVTEENLDTCLFDTDGPAALPAFAPYPTPEGLAFVYQQYEIAPYAAGMPSFTINYEDVKPYLTERAVKFLGLQSSLE